MALDYLSIPGKQFYSIYLTVCLLVALSNFNQCRTHFQPRSSPPFTCLQRLSTHLMHALLCLSNWSSLDLVKDSDIRASLTVDGVGKDVDELPEDWDVIGVV